MSVPVRLFRDRNKRFCLSLRIGIRGFVFDYGNEKMFCVVFLDSSTVL